MPGGVTDHGQGDAQADKGGHYTGSDGRLKAGANGFGLGSFLYKPGDTVADIAAKARDTVAAWDEITK